MRERQEGAQLAMTNAQNLLRRVTVGLGFQAGGNQPHVRQEVDMNAMKARTREAFNKVMGDDTGRTAQLTGTRCLCTPSTTLTVSCIHASQLKSGWMQLAQG